MYIYIAKFSEKSRNWDINLELRGNVQIYIRQFWVHIYEFI